MNSNRDSHVKTRYELVQEIEQIKLTLPEPLIAPRVFVTDITPEGLQQELADNGGRSAIISDEGNIFDIMAGLYSDGRSNLDVFLQGHSSGTIRVKRRDRKVYLENIALTLGLAVQPQILMDLKGGSKRSFRGKGLLARFLYCVPKSNIGKREVGKQNSMPQIVKDAYDSGIKKLLSITPVYDSSNKTMEIARLLRLNKEALVSWTEFSQEIESNQGEGGKYENHQDWTGKLPGQALRIAGLCHLAKSYGSAEITLSALSPLSPESDGLFITKETIEPVLDLCKKLIVHAQATFDLMENDEVIADAKFTLKWLLAKAERDEKGAFFIKQNALHCSSRFKKSKLERVAKALDVLRERNIISPRQQLPTLKPTYIYFINPTILKNAA